jgi:predicted RNase H-like HicB family nuclease
MPTTNSDYDPGPPTRTIRLIENPDGQWTASDLDVGVTAQGKTREEALSALDDVVAAVRGEGGHEPTDDEIRALGVDPKDARDSDGDLPDVLQ